MPRVKATPAQIPGNKATQARCPHGRVTAHEAPGYSAAFQHPLPLLRHPNDFRIARIKLRQCTAI